VVKFFILLACLAGAVGFGIYRSSSIWLSSVFNAKGQIDIELLKVLPAALAAVGASVVTAGASVINVGLQLRANKRLETHRITAQLNANKELEDVRKRLTSELDGDKNSFLLELEKKKNDLGIELDERKQALGLQLSVTKLEIERQLQHFDQAKDAVISYRYEISQIRSGEYDADEVERLEPKIIAIRDNIPRNSDLYSAWCWFHQLGFNLAQRAARLTTASRRRALWREINKSSGISVGLEFARKAEEVRVMIENKRDEILQNVGI
jgi:hypothetical protein